MNAMSGSVVDLSRPIVAVPNPIAVDSNVIVALLERLFPGQRFEHTAQAEGFFRHILENDQQAVLTPTAYSEILHVAVRKTYELRPRGNRTALSEQFGVPMSRWQDLYKQDPTPLQELSNNLSQLHARLVAYNVVIADLDDFGDSGDRRSRHFASDLIDRTVRYGLDSSDAMITLEASRLGIGAIVSMDREMQRAVADFDIYTWT